MLLILLFCACWLQGCANVPEGKGNPVRNLPARDLLLDVSAFPIDWVVSPCDPNCNRREGYNLAVRDFYTMSAPGGVVQEVHRLTSFAEAEQKYTYIRGVELAQQELIETMPPPDSVATHYEIGCGKYIVTHCKFMGQYETYVVYFYFATNDEGLSLEDVRAIITTFDHHIQKMFAADTTNSISTVANMKQ